MSSMSSMNRFGSILVANRGEIAARVMRTARAMGYRTIAVHSEADRGAPHVKLADDAVEIGPAPVSESYLDIERILDAARQSGAEAVHPGYGFLSENGDFARACEAAGLVFIGPTADAIDLMGNKAEAKRRMIEAGVPCVPGYEETDQSLDVFVREAARIGYPVMVKAAAGGGGRGMRRVADAGELPDALVMARAEAESAFGSGELILEKAIERPRHVEFQVFADEYGATIHLGERDCSVQRRHQKVVEEAPCPVMTPELRERMGAAAVEAARAIGYRGAGTVEFLLDENGDFYFLEMNTRLQVEHPVTEMITGLDLVEMQIRTAQGEPLVIAQSDVELSGHAVEVRLYAEDPAADFLPSTGAVDLWLEPGGAGVRVDAGIESGSEVSPYYDAMVAKIIGYGETRDLARGRLLDALERTALFGVRSNRDFLMKVLANDCFAAGGATTAFIAEEMPAEKADAPVARERIAAAAALQYDHERRHWASRAVHASHDLMGWSSSGVLTTPYEYDISPDAGEFRVTQTAVNRYDVTHGDATTRVEIPACTPDVTANSSSACGQIVEVLVDGNRHRAIAMVPEAGRIHLSIDGETLTLRNLIAAGAEEDEAAGGGRVTAPMHGMLLEIVVRSGDSVRKGDRIAVLEAMKMRHEITAEIDGTVGTVHREAGVQVSADELILEIDEARTDTDSLAGATASKDADQGETT